MKIRVLYEENIKNGHKNYTTIEIPDGDYSVMLDIDYEQRLAEANPEKKEEVKRCETLQEMFDLMNNKEYNHWRRYHRHLGNPKTPYRKDDEVEIDVMDTFADNSQEIERNLQDEYESVCQWIRSTLSKKPEWADAFIAVRINGISIREYATFIGASENNITQKLKRAKQKLRNEIENRQI
ncbi:RNA polymerase sigma factor [Listeria innocua]